MKAKNNQFYGKGVFEDIIKPKLLDNQIVSWYPLDTDFWRGNIPEKHIPVRCWTEVTSDFHLPPLGGNWRDIELRNQGGRTYLVTLIGKGK